MTIFTHNPLCVKCGTSSTVGRDYFVYKYEHNKATMYVSESNHIKVTCYKCGYTWSMKCKDAKE